MYKCSLCNYNTTNKNHIKKHLETIKCSKAEVITEESLVECEICNKKFENNVYLNQHKKNCVKKRVVPVIQYENSEIITNEINDMKKLILLQDKTIENIQKLNNDLIKRIEKLEESKKESKEKIELPESDDRIGCETSSETSFIPNSYKQILDKFSANGILDILKDNNYTVDLTIKGFRDQVIDGIVGKNSIEVDGKEYYYAKQRGKRCTEDLKIIITKQCLNEAKYVFNDKHYCDECV